MENLPATTSYHAPVAHNPFARMPAEGGLNAGSVAVESERAVAETQAKITVAKRFPRDTALVRREVEEACKYIDLAEVAFYALPRGGETIEGPTIKLAEELARCSGNIDYGHRELSRSEGKSEIEVYAWDMQTNAFSRRQLTVRHVIDLKGGKSRPTNSEKEIDDLIARKASAQLRGRILAILPKSLVQLAINICRQTLKGGNGVPLAERIDKMVAAFGKISVTTDMLTKRLGHPIGDTTADELVDLIGVFTAIREGHSTIDEAFPSDEVIEDTEKAGAQSVVKNQRTATPQGEKPAAKAATKRTDKPADKPATPDREAEKTTATSSSNSTNVTAQSTNVAAQPDQEDVPHSQPETANDEENASASGDEDVF